MKPAGVVPANRAALRKLAHVIGQIRFPRAIDETRSVEIFRNARGYRGVFRRAEKPNFELRERFKKQRDELAPTFDAPTFFGRIFRTADEPDAERFFFFRRRFRGNAEPKRRKIRRFEQLATFPQPTRPDERLMIFREIQIRGNAPRTREQRARMPGANHAATHGRAGKFRFNISAKRICEKHENFRIARAQNLAATKPVAEPAGFRGQGNEPIRAVQPLEHREKMRARNKRYFRVRTPLAQRGNERERHHDIAEPIRHAHKNFFRFRQRI